eukprot:2766211-Pleurochrysis_carterae.AAC.5
MRVGLYWSRQSNCLTPSIFLFNLPSAIPDSVVHSLVKYVHHYSDFLSETIYDNAEGTNDAREFILSDDGGACMHIYACDLLSNAV